MLVVGVDENGLGPLLGPLVVTAAAFEVEEYDRAAMWAALPDGLRADDSKRLFSRGTIAAAERDTLSWLGAFGVCASSHAELVRAIVSTLPWPLPCGADRPPACRAGAQPLPAWSDAVARHDRHRRLLESCGARPVAVRSLEVCAGAFNDAVGRPGMNKLRLDFELMLRLLAEIADEAGREVTAICGKVGSTRRYGPWLDGTGRWLWSALDETPERSTYRLAGLGTLSFERDADASHLPVAVASMVGKYLRELAMRQLNAALGPEREREASGYRDRITARFIEETRARREELGLPEHCFTRSR